MPPIHGPSRINTTSSAPQELSSNKWTWYRGKCRNCSARTKYAGANSGTNQRMVQHCPEELFDVAAYSSHVPAQQPIAHNTSRLISR
jgi:hypothetical protein